MRSKSFINWSGGKDSAFALRKAKKESGVFPELLITNVNEKNGRVSMHGVRKELIISQSEALNIPLQIIELPEQPSMEVYEQVTLEKMQQLKSEFFDTAFFGDIFLKDLRDYRENQLTKAGIQCVFPLWMHNTASLMQEFISSGFKAIVICVNENYLDKSFCGRIIDQQFLSDLPVNVDPAGENGEYHSFVFDGPDFKQPVEFKKGNLVFRNYPTPKREGDNCFSGAAIMQEQFCFLDLLP
ncbi:diphthine--ammonia ligase [soil metagenome]